MKVLEGEAWMTGEFETRHEVSGYLLGIIGKQPE